MAALKDSLQSRGFTLCSRLDHSIHADTHTIGWHQNRLKQTLMNQSRVTTQHILSHSVIGLCQSSSRLQLGGEAHTNKVEPLLHSAWGAHASSSSPTAMANFHGAMNSQNSRASVADGLAPMPSKLFSTTNEFRCGNVALLMQ